MFWLFTEYLVRNAIRGQPGVCMLSISVSAQVVFDAEWSVPR